MGAVHVGLTQMEIDHLVVSFPLVGGSPGWRTLPRNHSDVVGEVRRSPFGRDRSTLRIYTKVHSILPRAGRFGTHTQDPKIPF